MDSLRRLTKGWKFSYFLEKLKNQPKLFFKLSTKDLKAIHNGDFENVEFAKEADFELQIPETCPGVPSKILIPENTWKDQDKFREVKNKLVNFFKDNFNQFEEQVDLNITKAEPK